MTHPDVIVIGAGCAGLAAATALAEGGARVVVLEARRHLGGRTTAFDHRESGERVDNGQHVLLGCYRETRTYLRRLDVEHLVAFQPRLSFTCVDRDGRTSTLACPPWRPPLHLVGGLLRWKALGWRDRRSALGIAGALRSARRAVADGTPLPCVAGETVLRWLTRHGQSRRLIELLWEPLAVAAMNQPIDVADAAPFVRILGHVFTDDPADAGIGLPARPLDEVFGEPARAYLEARGGHVRTDALARVVLAGDRVGYVDARGTSVRAGAFVLATPWHGLTGALRGSEGGALAGLLESEQRRRSASIVSVHVWLERAALPAPFVGLPGRAFQWIFDKRSVFDGAATHMTLVASAADHVLRLTNEELAALALEEAWDALPELKRARVLHVRVVREPNATFSLAPGEPPRPGNATPVRNLWLAGDWTDTGLPATIEGAILSGHRAAEAVRRGI
jgi:squalene-associated FAD-dependent desaturase